MKPPAYCSCLSTALLPVNGLPGRHIEQRAGPRRLGRPRPCSLTIEDGRLDPTGDTRSRTVDFVAVKLPDAGFLAQGDAISCGAPQHHTLSGRRVRRCLVCAMVSAGRFAQPACCALDFLIEPGNRGTGRPGAGEGALPTGHLTPAPCPAGKSRATLPLPLRLHRLPRAHRGHLATQAIEVPALGDTFTHSAAGTGSCAALRDRT